jgi:hypothetical protein
MADINSNVNVGDNRGRVTGIDSRGSNRGGESRSDVHIDNSARNSPEMADLVRELRIAVFGDSMGWDGVLPRLRQIQKDVEDLHKTVAALQTTVNILQREVHDLKVKMSERAETSYIMRVLLWIVAIGVSVLVVIALWPLLR